MTPIACWIAISPPLQGWPIAFYVVPTLSLTILASAVVYHGIELPAIRGGKRLAGSGAMDSGDQAAP